MTDIKEETSSKKPYKRISYAVVGREGIQFRLGPNKTRGEISLIDDPDPVFNNEIIPCKDFEYAPNGTIIAIIDKEGVSIKGTDTGIQICRIERPGIQRVSLSPLGSYMLTWERFGKGDKENLNLWRCQDGEHLFKCFEKDLGITWPTIKFTKDEQAAAHMVKNEIHIYKNGDFSQFDIVKSEGLTQFEMIKLEGPISESNPLRLATFKPEISSGAAKLNIYNYPNNIDKPVGSRSFFRASEAVLLWNPNGDAVLCKTDTDIDKTGQSYYGESALYMLYSNGSFDCQILPQKEGAFQDISWCPDGKHFVAIAGKSPAASAMYNLKGEIVFDFGVAHRNTIRWSPQGRFLMLGGFGNLLGDMDFWDINKKAKMGSARADAAVSQEFSPCGRFFMVCTLFPRMRVDNGMTFYTYRGEKITTVLVRECSKAIWRPEPTGFYHDRAQTPLKQLRKQAKLKGEVGKEEKKVTQKYRPPGSDGSLSAKIKSDGSLGTGSAAYRPPQARSGPYRPPGSSARGVVGSANTIPGQQSQPSGHIVGVRGGNIPGAPKIPGMAPPAAKSKSAKRRARKKKAAAAGEETK